MPFDKKQRSSKLFQCTGYGDCCMVFTRGEHLSRHTRKHTGEKPFLCIMPNCNKTFSRYDNMMQHAQIHRREPLDHPSQQPHSPPTRRLHAMDKVVLRQPSTMNYSPVSPAISSVGSMTGSSCTSSDNEYDDDDEETWIQPDYFDSSFHDSWIASHRRRLTVAELCNPMDRSPLKFNQLTRDEVEVIQAFGKLQQATF